MPAVGLEPTRGYPQQILSLHRLPFRHAGERLNIIIEIGECQRNMKNCLLNFMVNKKNRKEIEEIVQAIKNDLSNNYKDNAKDNLKKLYEILENYKSKDLINEKDYENFKSLADGFDKDIQSFKRTY